MKLSAVQVRSTAGAVPANVAKHVEAVRLAVKIGAEFVLFPELSITSYEPTLAKQLAMRADVSRLDAFQSQCDSHGIPIGAGIPLEVATGVATSMVLLRWERTSIWRVWRSQLQESPKRTLTIRRSPNDMP